MNPLFLILGAGAAFYAISRSSSEPAAAPVAASRPLITYQMIREEDWISPGMKAVAQPSNQFVIVGKYPRGMFTTKVLSKKLPDGFYLIEKVLYNKSPGGFDIIPGYDHGWLWKPQRNAAGNIEVDAEGKEIWYEEVVPEAPKA